VIYTGEVRKEIAMRIFTATTCVLMAVAAAAQTPAPKRAVTPEEYERWKKELSWGERVRHVA
jgi:hypothetical protein